CLNLTTDLAERRITSLYAMRAAPFRYRVIAERCGNIDLVEHVWEYGGQERLIPVRRSWAMITPLEIVKPSRERLAAHRICLVIPPSIFLLDERVFMTLGILKVAAVLEQAGVNVDMLDLSGVENYEEVVRDYVKTSTNTCFGLTATTPQMPAATKIYHVIRVQKPRARIILGGPHVTLIHAAYKFEQKGGRKARAITAYQPLEEMFDVVVVGDG